MKVVVTGFQPFGKEEMNPIYADQTLIMENGIPVV